MATVLVGVVVAMVARVGLAHVGGHPSVRSFSPDAAVATRYRVRTTSPGGPGVGDTSSAKSRTRAAPPASWTFMVYMNADNDLEEFAIQDLNEMEQVGSSDDVNIVVQVDRTPGYDSSNGNWTGCRRYRISRDADTQLVSSPVLEDLGEVDMGDAADLQAFLSWAMANYPAQHYALDLWNHGAGFRSRGRETAGLTRGFSYDDTQGTHILTTALPAAIAAAAPLDVLLWDSSLMQMVEIAYQVGEAATFMVGSEESPPGDGYRYDTFLQELVTTPSLSPELFSALVVNETIATLGSTYEVTQSAVRLSAVPNLVRELHAFAGTLAGVRSQYATQLDAARTQAQRYGSGAYTYRDYKDLQDYAEKIKAGIPETAVQNRADAVIQALHSALVAEGHAGASVSRSHGLSLYVPPLLDYVALYDTLDFAHDTGWDEFLREESLPLVDLSLTKEVDNSRPAVGGNVVFTVTVTNAGPDAATGVAVKDQLPQGLTFVSATPSPGAYDDATGLWTVGHLDNGATVTLEVTATMAVSAAVVNVAQVQEVNEADSDSTPGNNEPDEDDQASAAVSTCAGWQLPIHLSAGQSTDDLVAGMSSCATLGYDANFDSPHAPNPPEPYVVGYFYHGWGAPGGNRFRTDVRQLKELTGNGTEVWAEGCDLRVEVSQPNTDVTLTLDLAEVPTAYPVYLRSCAGHAATDLRATNGQYTFNSSSDQLHRFELVVGQQAEEHQYATVGWTMASVPVEPNDPAPGAVFGSNFNPLVLYGWGCTSYTWLPEVHFGSGYWLLVPTAGATATLSGRTGPNEISLTCGPGWQMLGCVAQAGGVELSSCTLRRGADTKTWAQAVAAGWIADLAYGWSDTAHGYVTCAPAAQCVMVAWKAYWVLPLVEGLTLIAPAGGDIQTKQPASSAADAATSWSLRIEAAAASGSDTIEAQVCPTATPGFDGYTLDLPKAPSAPSGVTVEFTHPEWQATGRVPLTRLQTDTRAPVGATPTRWDFQIHANEPSTGLEVTLTTPDLTSLPNHLTAALVDLDGGKTQYLRTTRSYQFTLAGETPRRFQLVVEPRTTSVLRLSGITVLPTRGGGLTVQYVLNKPAAVQATIRSAAGRVVATMDSGRAASAGVNTLTLSSRAAGKALPRGVYLAELTACTEDGQAARAVQTFRCQ